MNSLSLYFKYIKMTINSQMAYKASFIMMSVGNFFLQFIEFVGVYALFQRFGSIKGWHLYEVCVFYGVIHCAFAIAECVGRGYDMFARYIRTGQFDRILLRPRTTTLQILGSEFQMMRIGRFIQGLLVLVIGVTHLENPLTLQGYVLIIFSIIGGVGVFIGLLIIQATLSFFTIQSLEVMNAFTYGGVQMAQYPINIYKKWFQKLFTTIIPIGAISYFPLSAIFREGSLVVAYCTPIIGVAFFFVTVWIFDFGRRYYCSTGS